MLAVGGIFLIGLDIILHRLVFIDNFASFQISIFLYLFLDLIFGRQGARMNLAKISLTRGHKWV